MLTLNLDQLYESWQTARDATDVALANSHIKTTRRLVASAGRDGWSWLGLALDNERRKWFVAAFFSSYPVPRRLLNAMIRAGVLEKDPSLNRSFIDPCVHSFGPAPVLTQLLTCLESGSNKEKAGAASALYWVPKQAHNNLASELLDRIHCQMLREFVNNPDLEVRRRIIPILVLEPNKYPENVRPLIAQAINIARSNSDEYIRHRVEIQLGGPGPFMAIPHAK